MAGLSSEDKFARNPHRASRDQQGHCPAMGRAGKAGRPPHPVFRMFHASPPPASTTARPGATGAQAAILCDPSRRIAQHYSHGFLIRDLELIHLWSGKSPPGPATPAPNAHTCQGCEGPAGPAKIRAQCPPCLGTAPTRAAAGKVWDGQQGAPGPGVSCCGVRLRDTRGASVLTGMSLQPPVPHPWPAPLCALGASPDSS